MKQAGLTHGGFYAHFASREAMLEEALDRAATDSLARLIAAGQRAEPAAALDAIAAAYLSDRHVEHPEAGCTLAALGSETARSSPGVRRVATRNVATLIRVLAGHLPGGDDAANRERALAMLASMVGALTIARAVDDPALGKQVRAAVARSITGTGTGTGNGAAARRKPRTRARRGGRAAAAHAANSDTGGD